MEKCSKINHSWHSDVVTKSWLTLSQRCGTVENESCGDVALRHCENVALWRCQDFAIMLLQRRHNIKHRVYRPIYYGQFWFLSRHRKVRELQKYLGIKSNLWQVRRTLVNSWFFPLLMCEQDKVTSYTGSVLHSKVAMKGLGRRKKRHQYNIVDLFPDIPTVPDKGSLHGEWTWNSNTKVLSAIKHTSFLLRTLYL